jgi:putative membrane protein
MSEPHRLHPAAIVVMALKVGRELLFPAILPAVVWLIRAGRSVLSVEGMVFVASGTLLFLVIIAAAGLLAWRRFTYRVDAGELRVEQGIVTHRRRSVPLERIQTVDVSQGLVQLVLGIVSVRVETASGGQDSEVFLPGISQRDAALLQRALVVAPLRAASALDETAAQTPHTSRSLSFADLLLAGSTAGRVGVALSIVVSTLAFADDLVPWERVTEVSSQASGTIAVALLIGGVLVFTWLLGVIGTVLAHARFTLTRDDEHLVIERGLLERRRATIPLSRIQAVRVVEGVLRQPLGLVELRVESAGYGRQAGESTVLFPLLRWREVAPFLQQMTPELAETVPVAPLPHRSRRRYAMRLPVITALFALLPAILIVTVARAANFDLFPRALAVVLLFPMLAALGLWQYRDTRWGLTRDLLTIRTRQMGRVTLIVPRRRIQSIDVQQSPFQRRADLATLNVRIASGSGGAAFGLLHVDATEGMRALQWLSPNPGIGRESDRNLFAFPER